jgi:hypothetical protein
MYKKMKGVKWAWNIVSAYLVFPGALHRVLLCACSARGPHRALCVSLCAWLLQCRSRRASSA